MYSIHKSYEKLLFFRSLLKFYPDIVKKGAIEEMWTLFDNGEELPIPWGWGLVEIKFTQKCLVNT